MGARTRWAVLTGTVVLAVAYLMSSAFGAGFVYYLTVDELQAQASRLDGRPVRIYGYVAPGTLAWDPARWELRFRLQGSPDGGPAVDVAYRGPRPDLLADGVEVIVEGRMASPGLLAARQVLVKCPSRFEAAEAPR